ncbi:MAG: isocitrate dehydrogenase (NADP(+)) [Bacteroidota bacterium]
MAKKYKHIQIPAGGTKITVTGGELSVPSNPIIPFIEGDGTGPDIWKAARKIFDAAVEKAYRGEKKIFWMEIYAGEKAARIYGENQWLPKETISAAEEFIVSIKGPLTTPVGEGMRSLNVTLRQKLDLFACIRPVKYFSGVPSPVKHPQELDIVVFRENTEDVYAGIEYKARSAAAKKLIAYMNDSLKAGLEGSSAIGIKPMSEFASKRLIKKAFDYALKNGRKSVTLVHKGNIMKYTEGAFRNWGYELAGTKEYAGKIITEEQLTKDFGGVQPENTIVLNDRIADNMFQQLLLRPSEYDVLATSNLNGDYISDAAAAQVGGLGIAPGGNISYHTAMFEATHGTAPKYAGQDKVNPGSVILSGAMMFEYMGWNEAARMIEKAMSKTIRSGAVTYDFARQMKNASELTTSAFAAEVIRNL